MPGNKYYAIKAALTAAERDMIAYYELCWMLNKTIPTVDQVVEQLRKKRPNIRHMSVNYYLSRQPVIQALEKRGIPFRQHTQRELTNQQIAAATVACNFADGRPLHVKLDELGVLPATYQAWLLDPQFKHLVETISERNLENIRPVAVTEYMRLIASGNWNAIKYYLDVTAAAQDNDQPQTEELLKAIIEIIQKHVKDGPTLDAIGQDILNAAKSRREVSAFIEHDNEEVVRAQRQLGI